MVEQDVNSLSPGRPCDCGLVLFQASGSTRAAHDPSRAAGVLNRFEPHLHPHGTFARGG